MAAKTDSVIRQRYARDLALCIARNDLHSMLTVKDSDGTAPIVVALGHEKADLVFQRIRAAGGQANLFVMDSSEHLHIIRMTSSAPGKEESSSSESPADVHDNITMDFLVHYMKNQPGQKGALRVSFSGIDMSAESAPDLQLAGIA